MHVAVPCGSVPDAKAEQRTNQRSPSHRQHHDWPKRLPNARAPVESQAVGRGPLGLRSPANHWADMGMRPNGLALCFDYLGARQFSATGFLKAEACLSPLSLRCIVK